MKSELDSNLKSRIITALMLTAVAVLLLCLPALLSIGAYVLQVCCFVLVVCCAIEFGIFHVQAESRWGQSVIVAGVCMLPGLIVLGLSGIDTVLARAVSATELLGRVGMAGFLGIVVASAVMVYAGRGRIAGCAAIAQVTFPAVAQIGFGGAALIALAGSSDSSQLIGLLLLAVCSNDIAAYFGGRRFGGPRLAPLVSPGKTVSGALCGLIAGVSVGVVAGHFFFSSAISVSGVGAMLMLIVCAQIGDLNKSYIKRVYGVKDSGRILPGHGGVYDRVDGILMAAPVLFFLSESLSQAV